MAPAPILKTIVQTLMGLGFRLLDTAHHPSYVTLTVVRVDEFGVVAKYLFACLEDDHLLAVGDVAALEKKATRERSALVIVGALATYRSDLVAITRNEFFGRLGGPISALLPLESEYSTQLAILGHNDLPEGMTGKADIRFEEYVHAGLQFMLQDRVVRYGQERLFEAVPDGLVTGRRSLLMLYDAKAAGDGYKVTLDSIRQFADYVNKFHSQYETYTGRLFCFLVISGDFQAEGTLEERAAQLYAECAIQARFMKASEMGKIVALMADNPTYRQTIDWKAVFSKTLITFDAVQDNLKARIRDKVIQK